MEKKETYIPTLGGSCNTSFDLQFSKAGISAISLGCTLVVQLSNDGKDEVVSHGSGSFWRHNGEVYLLTARHILSGRSPFDDDILSSNGYLPQRISVFPIVEDVLGNRRRIKKSFNLCDNEPNWFQDPEFGELRTDIAAIKIQYGFPKQIACLNDHDELFDEIFTIVGSECVIVGYPTTHFGDLQTPIWRKGSIASEPSLPIDSKPMFLLDAATSPGFSGAPVFRQHFGSLPEVQKDGTLNAKVGNILKTSFVGIYAGRLQHTRVTGEVPFVFYGNRVPRIFENI